MSKIHQNPKGTPLRFRKPGKSPRSETGNPNIVYAQWQRGNLNRHDRITGENVNIKPQPDLGEKTEMVFMRDLGE